MPVIRSGRNCWRPHKRHTDDAKSISHGFSVSQLYVNTSGDVARQPDSLHQFLLPERDTDNQISPTSKLTFPTLVFSLWDVMDCFTRCFVHSSVLVSLVDPRFSKKRHLEKAGRKLASLHWSPTLYDLGKYTLRESSLFRARLMSNKWGANLVRANPSEPLVASS